MKNYTVTETSQPTPDIFYLTVQAETIDDCFIHTPGQYATLGFTVNGRPTPMRCFSIANEPNRHGIITFGIRKGGYFTQAASMLKKGDKVFLQGPFGEFVVNPKYDQSVVMLAGGIGITPFLSMIRDSVARQSTIPFTLLFSAQTQAGIPFFNELLELERKNPRFKVNFFVSDGAITPVPGAKIFSGRISDETLTSITGGNFSRHTYFLCGPPGFMKGMDGILRSKGVQTENIVSEAFTQGASGRAVAATKGASAMVYKFAGFTLAFGIAAIMLLDLVRAVPKIQAANLALLSGQTTSQQISNTTPTPVDTSSSITNSYTQATPLPTATPQTYYQPPVQNYRQPVTSVS